MGKELIKTIRSSTYNHTIAIEREVLRHGIKINEVKPLIPSDKTFNTNLVNTILETSTHIENDNYNINPQSETIIKDQYGLK